MVRRYGLSTRDIEFRETGDQTTRTSGPPTRKASSPTGLARYQDEHTSLSRPPAPSARPGSSYNLISESLLPRLAWDKTGADEAVSDLDRTPEGPRRSSPTRGGGQNLSYLPGPCGRRWASALEALLHHPRSGPRTGPQQGLLGRGQAEDRQADLQSPSPVATPGFSSVRSGSIDFGYIPPRSTSQRKTVENKGYNVFLAQQLHHLPGPELRAPRLPSKYISQRYIRQAMQQLIDSRHCRTRSGPTYRLPDVWPRPPWQLTRSVPPKGASTSSIRTPQRSSWRTTAGRSCPTVNRLREPRTGEGQCGEGIAAGDKLSFKLVSQSGFVSTHQMFERGHLPSSASSASRST